MEFREGGNRGRGGRTRDEIWGKAGPPGPARLPRHPLTPCIPPPSCRGRPHSPPVFHPPETPTWKERGLRSWATLPGTGSRVFSLGGSRNQLRLCWELSGRGVGGRRKGIIPIPIELNCQVPPPGVPLHVHCSSTPPANQSHQTDFLSWKTDSSGRHTMISLWGRLILTGSANHFAGEGRGGWRPPEGLDR